MSRLLRCFAVAVVVSSSFSCFGQIFSFDKTPVHPQYVPGQVLVRFRPGRAASAKLSAHSRATAVVRRQYAIVPDLQLVSVSSTTTVESAIAAYRSDPNVLYAEPNYIRHAIQSPATPNDPMFPNLWGLHNTGADGGTAGADIKAPEAWAISKGSKNVVVAVIDSGIDYTHPDLAANIWNNTADCNNDGFDDDGDGYKDDCHGIDAANSDSDPMDDHGHGTHVAGSTPPPPPIPTATLTATPATIGTGQTSMLTWSTTNATTITMDGETVVASGTRTVAPATTTTYHLLAKGSGGSKEATATVAVINTTTATVTVKVSAAGVERTATVTVIMPA